MEFIRFLLSRIFLKNLAIALGIAIILITSAFWGLNIYTKHDKSFPVPNLRNMSLDSAINLCVEQKLKYSIYDSVFVDYLPGGTIIDQFPDSGFFVKENRNIYLTINMTEAMKILMPNLIDQSYRQARRILERSGLKMGTVSFEPNKFRNLVLKQLLNDTIINEGDIISKGSRIDLVLGQGSSEEETLIPYLISLPLDSAMTLTSDAYLNIGAVIYDETVLTSDDSINALIYMQKPKADLKSTIMLGSSIDIWLTKNDTKIELDTIFLHLNDSLDILYKDSVN